MKTIIAPSVLACDFKNLSTEIQKINDSNASWIHFDVMDGVLVPNISFGFPILEAVRSLTTKFIDVHLMIVNPSNYFKEFKKLGADHLSIHLENNNNLEKDIQDIKLLGMTAGIVLNPDTPIEQVFPYLKHLDLVLIMAVFPGFGGQAFIEATYQKVNILKSEILKQGLSVKIEVDGGVSNKNSKKLIDNGADVLVSGSALFKSENFQNYIDSMVI